MKVERKRLFSDSEEETRWRSVHFLIASPSSRTSSISTRSGKTGSAGRYDNMLGRAQGTQKDRAADTNG